MSVHVHPVPSSCGRGTQNRGLLLRAQGVLQVEEPHLEVGLGRVKLSRLMKIKTEATGVRNWFLVDPFKRGKQEMSPTGKVDEILKNKDSNNSSSVSFCLHSLHISLAPI